MLRITKGGHTSPRESTDQRQTGYRLDEDRRRQTHERDDQPGRQAQRGHAHTHAGGRPVATCGIWVSIFACAKRSGDGGQVDGVRTEQSRRRRKHTCERNPRAGTCLITKAAQHRGAGNVLRRHGDEEEWDGY